MSLCGTHFLYFRMYLWLLWSLAGLIHAQNYAANVASPILDLVETKLNDTYETLFNESLITSQVLNDFLLPLEVVVARNSYVYRDGSSLKLNGQPWLASGANVYWLGLDENVQAPPGQPFYKPYNASYPTKGRVTEVMNMLATMGARTIRSQTLGISIGNPLSLEPELGVFNDKAFETIDWAVYQAREPGLRIMAPLIDNYVRSKHIALAADSEGISHHAGLLSWWQIRLSTLARHQHIIHRVFQSRPSYHGVLY